MRYLGLAILATVLTLVCGQVRAQNVGLVLSAQASPSTVSPGQTETLALSLTSVQAQPSLNATIALSLGARLLIRQQFVGLTLAPGVPLAKSLSWPVPAAAPTGTYTVSVTVGNASQALASAQGNFQVHAALNAAVAGNTTGASTLSSAPLLCGHGGTGTTATWRCPAMAASGTTTTSTSSASSSSGSTALALGTGAINGQCGVAAQVSALSSMPTLGLCSSGVATPVSAGATAWTWRCLGAVGGTTANCSTQNACATLPTGSSASFDPTKPAASGYELVFDDEFNDLSSIDLAYTKASGYNWYLTSSLHANQPTPANNFSVNNGILTIAQSTYNFNWAMASAETTGGQAGTAPWQQGWHGHVFGGGAFFEARLRFDPSLFRPATGTPAFWSDGVEGIVQYAGPNWPPTGSNYIHLVENDFFEFFGGGNYAATLHDWLYSPSCSIYGCNISNAPGGGSQFANNMITMAQVDWTQFHVIAQLWVAGSGGTGYVQNYIDGVAVAKTWWSDSSSDLVPPSGYNVFNMMDKEHLMLILGSGQNQPMDVDWVHVWQLPAAASASGNNAMAPQAGFTGAGGSCSPTH